jgi:hypothetical protein
MNEKLVKAITSLHEVMDSLVDDPRALSAVASTIALLKRRLAGGESHPDRRQTPRDAPDSPPRRAASKEFPEL